DAIRAIRAAWGQRVPVYHGTHYDFEGFIVEPSGLTREIEVWVGGRTRRSLRRALEVGHAWMPFGMELEQLGAILTSAKVRDDLSGYADRHGRPLKLILAPEPPIDPLAHPGETTEFLAAYVAIGATGFSVRFDHRSPAHFCEQMAALRSVVDAAGF
ncbi:MAG: LLM class flavin-dependent oxidoreductase, partial [Acidimicrobiales bacterium]|nr:LLM class flavin-dependent oxidoreductase [Acidimicrobiales bacterium]